MPTEHMTPLKAVSSIKSIITHKCVRCDNFGKYDHPDRSRAIYCDCAELKAQRILRFILEEIQRGGVVEIVNYDPEWHNRTGGFIRISPIIKLQPEFQRFLEEK